MLGPRIVGLSCIGAYLLLAACVALPLPTAAADEQVEIVEPFEYSAAPIASMLGFKFAALAGIDPDHPLADGANGQTLSLFGREGLIAESSSDYAATDCAPASNAADVFAEIEDRARTTSIVIINESHERSEHRGFIAEVGRRLRPLGYNTLAIETLANPVSGTAEQRPPPFQRLPSLPYFEDADGYYLSEASFGRLGRLSKTLRYRLLAYEPNTVIQNGSMTRTERISIREEGQATNLAAFLQNHPDAKLLVHVGYSHAGEVPLADGTRWMAARLKEKIGIDPLTISQTTCRGGAESIRLATLPASEPVGRFDLVIDHPRARFDRGRPIWRKLAGDRPVSIPARLHPSTGWRVIEARPVGEPSTSVPMDRVAIRAGEDVALMLPPGRYGLRIIDVPTNAALAGN